jgi:hypothetical protein
MTFKPKAGVKDTMEEMRPIPEDLQEIFEQQAATVEVHRHFGDDGVVPSGGEGVKTEVEYTYKKVRVYRKKYSFNDSTWHSTYVVDPGYQKEAQNEKLRTEFYGLAEAVRAILATFPPQAFTENVQIIADKFNAQEPFCVVTVGFLRPKEERTTKPVCAKCGSDEFCLEVLVVKKAIYRVTENGAQEIQAYEEELPKTEGGRRVCTCRKCNFVYDFDAFERWILMSWGETS